MAMSLPPFVRLGVNVDHIATLRQARGTRYPDPVIAAAIAESAGAGQITVHLREDRRHIQDRDVRVLRETVQTLLNLEMAATEEMLQIALEVGPDIVTLVPEKREEQTTEGGLDVLGNLATLTPYIQKLKDADIEVSLFIDPSAEQIDATLKSGAQVVELHTGDYCLATKPADIERELDAIRFGARYSHELGLRVAAGHGLDLRNTIAIAALPWIGELNIGHSIVARAAFIGFDEAVREMIDAIERGRSIVEFAEDEE